MWRALIAVMLVTLLAMERSMNAQAESSRLRPESAAMRALIGRGLEGSATFRYLNSRIDSSNLIVYARFAPCSSGVPSCLVWAASSSGTRRLLIKLDRFGRSPNELTALLAHELQHANEVADDVQIADLASFQQSFAARGHQHSAGYETEEAARVSRTVAAELTRASKP